MFLISKWWVPTKNSPRNRQQGHRQQKPYWWTEGTMPSSPGPIPQKYYLNQYCWSRWLWQRYQNTQCNTACCVWGCLAAAWSKCSCWFLYNAKNSNTGHGSIRTGPWSSGSNGCWMSVHHLRGKEMAPGCTIGKRIADRVSVMSWIIFCWEILGPGIHVD